MQPPLKAMGLPLPQALRASGREAAIRSDMFICVEAK